MVVGNKGLISGVRIILELILKTQGVGMRLGSSAVLVFSSLRI